jgi:SAM-dependent methyltransferase
MLKPVSDNWGFDRGLPIDRYYIEKFLAQHGSDIRGNTLEIGDSTYCRRFGGDRVTHCHILDVRRDNPKATIVADLARAPEISSDSFDTVICTQTLQLLPDIGAGVSTLFRILRPGGVALVTIPVVSPLALSEKLAGRDCWRLTVAGATWLFSSHFNPRGVTVEGYGNLLAATAFLHGLAVEDLDSDRLDLFDARYQILTAVHARKRQRIV